MRVSGSIRWCLHVCRCVCALHVSRFCTACVWWRWCALCRCIPIEPRSVHVSAAIPVPDPCPCVAYVSPLWRGLCDLLYRHVYFFISRAASARMTCKHTGCARHAATRACSKRGPSANKSNTGVRPIPLYDFVGGQNVSNYYTHATQHPTTIMWHIPLYDFIWCQNVSFYT